MPVKPIPEGYHSIQPYLIFEHAAQAIDFYQQVFGAKEKLRMEQPDGQIDHAEIQIGNSIVMLADEHPRIHAFAPAHYGGSPITLLFYTEDCDATYRRAIAAGAKSFREPEDQFYGDRVSGVEDPFGYKWHIATHIKDVSKDEMEQHH